MDRRSGMQVRRDRSCRRDYLLHHRPHRCEPHPVGALGALRYARGPGGVREADQIVRARCGEDRVRIAAIDERIQVAEIDPHRDLGIQARGYRYAVSVMEPGIHDESPCSRVDLNA